MAEPATTHGEHPNGRRAMDDLIRRKVEGGVKPADAERQARESALRNDRKGNR